MRELAAGTPARQIESELVDVKEEPGRRGNGGAIAPGQTMNEKAASYLAGELACMATSGGGALVLGVADDGEVIGTDLDVEWLRQRIFELTDGKLTVSAAPFELRNARVIELVVPSALEPIRFRRKIRHRVGTTCVEIDAATWADAHHVRVGYDWSAQLSGRTLDDVRAGAMEVARDFLRASEESPAAELARTDDHDLVRRLNLCNDQGQLLNAGAILLCPGPAMIDYRRRDSAGGDAITRINISDRSLLKQLVLVIDAIRVHNPLVELDASWIRGRVNRIPSLAAREAVVNGVTHRDWQSPAATEVEHVGDRFAVTSPGGFVGGVAPSNIITHPSAPRYPRLAEALATLRIAERQGIGVDRMHRDMLALGLPAPSLEQLPGPMVRIALIGGTPEESWLSFRSRLQPPSARDDLDFLLILYATARRGWISGEQAAATIQRSRLETNDVLFRMGEIRLDNDTYAMTRVAGDPLAEREPYDAAWQLSRTARDLLASSPRHHGPAREDVLVDYARTRGRISSKEAASLIDTSSNTARTILDDLTDDGILQPGRSTRRGRGFFYVPAPG